jgi:hypothetical protein
MARLWFTPDEISGLRGRARTPWLAEVVAAAHAHAEAAPGPAPDADLIEAAGVTYLLTGEVRHARRAAEATLAWIAPPEREDLGAAAQLLAGVMAHDLCATAWSLAPRRAVVARLGELARRLAGTALSRGNPDNPFNNWWGVTHSAVALTALALGRVDPSLRALGPLADERVRTYLLNYGDHGHYYEGTGYGFYALSHWAPYVLAARRVTSRDPAAASPGLARLPALVHALTVARPQVADAASDEPAAPRLGMRVAWNDDGGQWPGGGVAALLLALASPADRPGLRWLHDRLGGPRGDRADASPRGALWQLLYYPATTPARRPRQPLHCHDQRTGLVVFRNRYHDAHDCVFAAYAKSYHGGGHVQEDLGSWRLQGLGAGWAQAGGQAKAAAPFQCVVTRDGRPNDGRHGQVSYLAPAARPGHGGSVSLRLGPASGSRIWDRHFAVDFSGDGGVPAVIGLVDECGHEAEAEWTWSLCFERHLRFVPLPRENGFKLVAPDGATLALRFGAPAALRFQLHLSPPSERRFSNGQHRVYPGVPYVTATVRAARVTFAAVATLHPGRPPPLRWRAHSPEEPPEARVAGRRVRLARGKWFHGPLRIEPAART